MCPWLNNSKVEVKVAIEMLIMKKEGVYDSIDINNMVSIIGEPTRSLVRKELDYMSNLSLDELYLELEKCYLQ